MANPAVSARQMKEEHPSDWCPSPRCLWRIRCGGTEGSPAYVKPCQKHPELMPRCEGETAEGRCRSAADPVSRLCNHHFTGRRINVPVAAPRTPAPTLTPKIDLDAFIRAALNGVLDDEPYPVSGRAACDYIERLAVIRAGRPLSYGERAQLYVAVSAEWQRREAASQQDTLSTFLVAL